MNWHNMVTAVSGQLEYERLCNRRNFIDESIFRRSCVEFIQSSTNLELTPEYNHDDLPGNKRLDIVGRSSNDGPLSLAIEAKWVRSRGGTRRWLDEVAEAALRLERIITETNQHTDRALLVGGISRTIQARIVNQEVNIGGGRRKAFRHVLQSVEEGDEFTYNQKKIEVRECDSDFERFFSTRADELDGKLPVSYQSAMGGHHKAGPKVDSIEMYAWVIRRSRNRSTFDPDEEFS